ncbi:MAG TPA: DNA methyltransferase [Anaerolineales bacterium]|nr:DNA methyltransferase [Anaerolineales bacterium]
MNKNFRQRSFDFFDTVKTTPKNGFAEAISSSDNSIQTADRAFHDWYRFVLSYPPHLVRDYIQDFELQGDAVVLDPFCGTGTTLVEAQLNHLQSIGLEVNPFPFFATRVKTDWKTDPKTLKEIADEIAETTLSKLFEQGIDDRNLQVDKKEKLRALPPEVERALIKDSISPIPLHKSLVLLDKINGFRGNPAHQYCILALGNALITSIGNLRFGPEVGVGKIKKDVHVVAAWKNEINRMANDLETVYGEDYRQAQVYMADARNLTTVLQPHSVDAVISSPPYPNEKDYTRTTRLESVLLGFIEDMTQLRTFKKTFLRSNTRGVYKSDNDDLWINDHKEIQALAQKIETRRIELGKTSGFEKLYGRVTKLYFGGMARHLTELTSILKPGARLAYVVGDQASYLRVMIRTGQLLASIAEKIGYEVERIDLFRTRFATATQDELREEVVVLRWRG